jgi:hypothetical protein
MPDQPTLTDSAAVAVAMIEERLTPHGWHVAVRTISSWVNVSVEHELSPSSALGFPDDDSDQSRLVETWLSGREFSAVAQAPAGVPHAPLIKRIRAAAAANRWGDDVVTPSRGCWRTSES